METEGTGSKVWGASLFFSRLLRVWQHSDVANSVVLIEGTRTVKVAKNSLLKEKTSTTKYN